jgi:hypothetical protein
MSRIVLPSCWFLLIQLLILLLFLTNLVCGIIGMPELEGDGGSNNNYITSLSNLAQGVVVISSLTIVPEYKLPSSNENYIHKWLRTNLCLQAWNKRTV